MPIIATIKGIRIYINYSLDEHNPPHIHGVYDNKRCTVDLNGKVLVSGGLNKNILSLIIDFVNQHKNTLLEMWNTQNFKKII